MCSWVIEVIYGNLDNVVLVTCVEKFDFKNERESLILFDGSGPQSINNFEEKINEMSSGSLNDNVWVLVTNSDLKSDLVAEFPMLADSQNIRLDSRVYVGTLIGDTFLLYEIYRIWWNSPLSYSCILTLKESQIVHQSDFIWNRRKDLQGLLLIHYILAIAAMTLA